MSHLLEKMLEECFDSREHIGRQERVLRLDCQREWRNVLKSRSINEITIQLNVFNSWILHD